MHIKVLGPIEVTIGDRIIRLAGQRQRALLAALVLDHGRVVPVARLVDVLWDSRPPATALAKIHAHVSGFRRAIGHAAREPGGPLLTSPPGYLLSIEGVELDLAEFENLTARGAAALGSGRPAMASELFGAGLVLWRGTAFADVTSPLIRSAATALEERRLLAVEAKAEADLALGHNELVLAELPSWLSAHPLRERLRALLILALYRRGCRADALVLHRTGRQIMIEELGLEPGPQLLRLHQLILAGDPILHTTPVDILLSV